MQNLIEPFFLGPKSENEIWMKTAIEKILAHWFEWRRSLFTDDPSGIEISPEQKKKYLEVQNNLLRHVDELSERLKGETPKYTPRYLGHMVSETSLPAILGHLITLLHNPNNTSFEAARVGILLEKEAIAMLAELIGFSPPLAEGHFTSGGTIANFEAIWRARFRLDHWLSLALYLADQEKRPINIFKDSLMGWAKFESLVTEFAVDVEQLRKYSPVASNPWKISSLILQLTGEVYSGPVILVPGNKHFSWQKGCNVFGLGEEALWHVPLNEKGQICCDSLVQLIKTAESRNRPVQMVVSVAGTTEAGEIDPIHRVQGALDALKIEMGVDLWHHVDAAYGGFMCSLLHQNEIAKPVVQTEQLKSLAAICKVSSVTMDPHKLGYIPYACGAFLVPDKTNYMVSKFYAPYLKRTDLKEEKWAATLEGSRTAAGASATWLSGKTMPFTGKSFAQLIANSFQACQEFKSVLLKSVPEAISLPIDQTNILCFSIAKKEMLLSKSNHQTLALFQYLADSPDFSVSKTTFHRSNYARLIDAHLKSFSGESDCDELILIRCVFMNPFWGSKKLRDKVFSELVAKIAGFLSDQE